MVFNLWYLITDTKKTCKQTFYYLVLCHIQLKYIIPARAVSDVYAFACDAPPGARKTHVY